MTLLLKVLAPLIVAVFWWITTLDDQKYDQSNRFRQNRRRG